MNPKGARRGREWKHGAQDMSCLGPIENKLP